MNIRYTKLQRLRSFRAYCENNNLYILDDDLRFIDKKLDMHRKTDFKAILERYVREWIKGMDESIKLNEAQSNGRKRANLWLMDYTDMKMASKI